MHSLTVAVTKKVLHQKNPQVIALVVLYQKLGGSNLQKCDVNVKAGPSEANRLYFQFAF